MGGRNTHRSMRVFGIVLVIFSLGCLSALDESFEAGHTHFDEVTKIPTTEVAEMVLPQTTLKARATSETRAGSKSAANYMPSPAVREKHVKKDKAFETFKRQKERWLKARKEEKIKREIRRKAEKRAKEKKAKAREREKKVKAHARERKAKERKAKERKATEKKAKEKKAKVHARERKAKERK